MYSHKNRIHKIGHTARSIDRVWRNRLRVTQASLGAQKRKNTQFKT